MGRELQKKKNRSSIVKPGATKKKRPGNKTHKPILANSFLAENWDKRQTVAQNYARLGLVRRLGAPTGGVEKFAGEKEEEDARKRSEGAFAVKGGVGGKTADALEGVVAGEARIERDEKTGAIVRVLEEEGDVAPVPRFTALHDPLDALDDEDESDGDVRNGSSQHDPSLLAKARNSKSSRRKASATSVVSQLERDAAEQHAAPKKQRKASSREAEWLKRLIAKHGADEDGGSFERMARDTELNVRQQSAGDLKRRVRKLIGAVG